MLFRSRPGPTSGLVLLIVGLLAALLLCVVTLLEAFGEEKGVERAAADPSTIVKSCTCVEGPLASEIEKLRTQIRLLKAAAKVNTGIQCAAARREKKR